MKQSEIVGGKIGFLVMKKWESMDIDEPKDFEFAEFLLVKTGRCKKQLSKETSS
jgi:CMP-N-acetylneuraminic acid synthetase